MPDPVPQYFSDTFAFSFSTYGLAVAFGLRPVRSEQEGLAEGPLDVAVVARARPVAVPVLRAGNRIWAIELPGEPDPEYGYTFGPAELDRWSRARSAALRLVELERSSLAGTRSAGL
jgi:hypothetical protein